MQEDIRLPIVYSKMLTRLRFVPNEGSREIYILNFASHSESLQGINHHVSADFPAYLREKILKETGAETIYFVGAIGGMISMNIPDEQQIRQSGGNFLESTKRIGRQLADYALAIKNETEVKPKSISSDKNFMLKVTIPYLCLQQKSVFFPVTDTTSHGLQWVRLLKQN